MPERIMAFSMHRMLPGTKVDDRPNTHAVAYYATTDQIGATYRQALEMKKRAV